MIFRGLDHARIIGEFQANGSNWVGPDDTRQLDTGGHNCGEQHAQNSEKKHLGKTVEAALTGRRSLSKSATHGTKPSRDNGATLAFIIQVLEV